eukprot:GHVT01000592.1.p1 GENE.GHVT01000592.1~~GHVT01000592.1.p1  ORF type:complete len:208 (+),score=37.68 GHVT01000592.1:129-752(+)
MRRRVVFPGSGALLSFVLPSFLASRHFCPAYLSCAPRVPAMSSGPPFTTTGGHLNLAAYSSSSTSSQSDRSPSADKHDEAKAALSASSSSSSSSGTTLFGRIVSGEVPCSKVYEDSLSLAFDDLHPQAPTHIIIIPKVANGLDRLGSATEAHKQILGHLMWVAAEIARRKQLGDFRTVVNSGPTACQSIYHLHVHLLAGRKMNWPPG